MINYIKGDLVKMKLGPDDYKLHACNAQGVWGAGIALAFREAYPDDYREYQNFCKYEKDITGSCLVTDRNIVCLITSEFYNPADAQYNILNSTRKALDGLGYYNIGCSPVGIYSNRFNSGLFHVPWEKTEALILEFLEQNPNIKWTVVDL